MIDCDVWLILVLFATADLAIVENRVITRAYTRLSDFVRDVTKIFDNCRLYNPTDSPFYQCAEVLETYFVQKLKSSREQFVWVTPSTHLCWSWQSLFLCYIQLIFIAWVLNFVYVVVHCIVYTMYIITQKYFISSQKDLLVFTMDEFQNRADVCSLFWASMVDTFNLNLPLPSLALCTKSIS